MLPEWFYLPVAALFGLVIGSFLNVVIYRLHTGKSLNDRSHCLSCGAGLRWYELFPVFSYLALIGRCRACGSFIPYRYALVELATAGAFVLAYLKAADIITFVLLAVVLSVLIVGLVYDLYHMIIPDEVSYGAAALAAALVGWNVWIEQSWQPAWSAALGAAVIFVIFASLWYFSRGRAFGFGDAKLSLSLGALAGLPGVFSLIVLSFWIGAAAGLALIAGQYLIRKGVRMRGARRVTMKSEVPFAPFLIAAFVLVYFFDVQIFELIEAVYVGF